MASVEFKFDDLMDPVVQALRELGGSGTNEEINQKVAEIVAIPSEQLEVLHSPEKGGITEIDYRLMWTRTYLRRYGLIENSARGVWSLTPLGMTTTSIDKRDITRTVREQLKKDKVQVEDGEAEPDRTVEWQEELLGQILELTPSGFERLIQRLLRESGFIQVEVTGQSGDGGVDGHGILRLGGFLGFRVIFQAKRWRGAVGSSQIRDFRGAMVGRADKGLLITTGTFTKDAVREASRDGAPAIDLVDGDQLVEKLKQLSLGVRTRMVEEVIIDSSWFQNI